MSFADLIPFCELLTWKDCGPYAVAAVALASLIATLISTNWWNHYRNLADRNFEILRLGVQNPQFMDPSKTRRFNETWSLGTKERHAYEAYARLCWSHARDIYSVRLLFFLYRKWFKKNYANTLETYRRLHGIWFKNNRSVFPDKRFIRFIEKCEWRKYFDARTADMLRWNNEVEDYDNKILQPLLVTQKNPLLDFISSLPKNSKLTVADVGCGTGSFLAKLATDVRSEKIYGIDYSRNMVEIALEKCKGFKNVEILNIDMKDLKPLYNKIDIVFSLNSILPQDPRDTEPMLHQIAKTLKPGAQFVAILPSFDTVEYLKNLEFKQFKRSREQNLKKYPFKKILCYFWAWFDTRNLFLRERKMNKRKRLYADDGVNIQRFIHKRDIRPLLAKIGLTLQREPEKLHYPWELAKKFDYGDFPGEEEIWDWFIVAWKGSEESS